MITVHVTTFSVDVILFVLPVYLTDLRSGTDSLLLCFWLCIYQLSVDDAAEEDDELSVADVSVSVAGAPVPAMELS